MFTSRANPCLKQSFVNVSCLKSDPENRSVKDFSNIAEFYTRFNFITETILKIKFQRKN